MARYDDLPYRTCVGITLINPEDLCSSAAAWAGLNMSIKLMSGKCRKAASIPAKIPGPQPSASFMKKPMHDRSRS
jgi:hypothetical protein